MPKLFPIAATALLLVAVACGSTTTPEAAIRGKPGTTTSTSTTSTTIATTTTTLPVQVTDIPSVDDLGLTWDQPATVDPVTGRIDMADFNSYLIAKAPTAMLPEADLARLSGTEAIDAVEAAKLDSFKKAVALFLGLDASDPNNQMLVGEAGGPEATRIIVVQLAGEGADVRATRYEFVLQNQDRAGFAVADAEIEQAEEGLEGLAEQEQTETESQVTPEGVEEETDTVGPKDLIPTVNSGYESTQCEPGPGHQDFATGNCSA